MLRTANVIKTLRENVVKIVMPLLPKTGSLYKIKGHTEAMTSILSFHWAKLNTPMSTIQFSTLKSKEQEPAAVHFCEVHRDLP